MIAFIPRRGRVLLTAVAAILFIEIAGLSGAMAEESAVISLKIAIEVAISQRPELKAFSRDILAATARVTKSAALPNPELGIETSSLGDEDSVVVSQAFEFGHKRDARIKAAGAEIPLYENDRERTRLDIINQVSLAFVAMLGAQEKRTLVQRAHEIAERFADTVTERVYAGAISPIEETRAKVLLAGASTDLAAAQRELEQARLTLASAMGNHEAGFIAVCGHIPSDPIVPDKNARIAAVASSPDLARWKLERDQKTAVVVSEMAARIPDITFSGKLSYDRENEETALIVGMSVPLPLFNRNRGGILEARAELEKISYSSRSEELRVRSEIEKRHAAMQALAIEIGIVRNQLLSFAQEAHDAVFAGYHLGKFRYLDVLDASKDLTGAKLRHLELRISFELEKTAMNRLIATGQDRLEGELK